ncbi:23S rRNA (uracil(1939)-C(5))-methyltransferase RlmD [Anaerococcus sp. mt242]|uniref:23S rRNA (uracil(1939)-C(5))-methyltransferase RlmD n=1 Tax=Anaerococcus sp. mt242 TaxID=2661917 RepID=UPI0019327B40|nr:23S rRNA (uracil(1939)-C(5))-methyltransferase RlmD [Anaerococcus sp. mt242]MBM0045971.1 23S rRNA (uracil(1939)-C(5))-methyltransferase RlmD [Anaerococcus sp. mt242]
MIIKNIKIIDILQDGRGVARTEGKTVFVENAVYGETLDAEILAEKKNFLEARKSQTKLKSDYQRKPPCPYFYECGGCSIMDINYKTQIDLKQNLIKNAIKKSTGINLEDIEVIESPEFSYRNKIRLQVDKDGGLNYLETYSKKMVKIDDCLIANEKIAENLVDIAKITREINQKFTGIIEEISIRASEKNILLNLQGNFNNKAIAYIKERYSNSIYNINLLVARDLIIISGEGYLDYKIGQKEFKISANDFYQVNDYQIEKLYGVAREFLGENQKLLDLYCGSATSSMSINDDNIVGVEINKNAIEDAKENAKRNGLRDYKFIAKNAKFIDNNFINKEKIDAITVDPPRAGLDKEVVKTIANADIEKIVYISCNPQTLARDIKRFIDRGYKLEKIKAVDMFPQTMHVETVVLMSRK